MLSAFYRWENSALGARVSVLHVTCAAVLRDSLSAHWLHFRSPLLQRCNSWSRYRMNVTEQTSPDLNSLIHWHQSFIQPELECMRAKQLKTESLNKQERSVLKKSLKIIHISLWWKIKLTNFICWVCPLVHPDLLAGILSKDYQKAVCVIWIISNYLGITIFLTVWNCLTLYIIVNYSANVGKICKFW